MKYKCPQCDFTSDKPGTCPVHNVALAEVAGGTPAASTAPTEGAPKEAAAQ